MKIGLDSTRQEFSKGLVEELEKEEVFVVDMFIKKERNEGYEIYKKVMEANKSRLDLFIGIYLTDKDEREKEIIVLHDCTLLGEKFGSYIYDSLRGKYGNKNLRLRCGNELYILKEIKAPAVIVQGNLIENLNEIEETLKDIIKNILKRR